MGIYSTLTVSRSGAIEAIKAKLNSASNDELSLALFSLLSDNTSYNYTVTSDGLPEEDNVLRNLVSSNWDD